MSHCLEHARNIFTSPLLLLAILTRNFLCCYEMVGNYWGLFVLLINLVLIFTFVVYRSFASQHNSLSINLQKLDSSFVANAVLEGACDRVIVGDIHCDIPLGLYVIRGENVVLIGELAQKVEREATELEDTMKKRMDFLDMD